MRNLLLIITFLLLFSFKAGSQTTYEYKVDKEFNVNSFMGTIVLLDGSAMFGEIEYDNYNDVVTVKKYIGLSNETEENKKFAFHYSKIDYMYQFDNYKSIDYNYFILIKTMYGYDFYKVMSHGNLTFVRSEDSYEEKQQNGEIRKILTYDYFYLNNKNELVELSVSKSKLKILFKKEWNQINDYMNKMDINFKDITKNDVDLVRILNFYNGLKL